MAKGGTILLLVGSGRPVWLEVEHKVPLAVIHSALAKIGMVATDEEIKLLTRIKKSPRKEAIALARAHNKQKLAEWPSMAMHPPQLTKH